MSRRPGMGRDGAGRPRATEEAIFRREGEYWTVARGDRLVRLRHSKGLEYIAVLLARPGEAIPVTEFREAGAPDTPLERERVRVTKAIRIAARRIAASDPALGDVFARTLRTGARCGYHPGPYDPLEWRR